MDPKRKHLAYVLTAVFVALLCVLIILQRQSISNQLHAWKLLPQTDGVTELYFSEPSELAATYQSGERESVRFVTHNSEDNSVTYTYAITASSKDGLVSQQLATDTFALSPNQQKSLDIPITMPALGAEGKVTISLSNTNQVISYWVKEGPAHDQKDYRPDPLP